MTLERPRQTLSDGIVTLRPLSKTDLPAMQRIFDDPEVVKWFGRQEHSAADFLMSTEDGWRDGARAAFAILPEARDHGYATRALRLVSRWALTRTDTVRVDLWAGPETSQRVAEKGRISSGKESSARTARSRGCTSMRSSTPCFGATSRPTRDPARPAAL